MAASFYADLILIFIYITTTETCVFMNIDILCSLSPVVTFIVETSFAAPLPRRPCAY